LCHFDSIPLRKSVFSDAGAYAQSHSQIPIFSFLQLLDYFTLSLCDNVTKQKDVFTILLLIPALWSSPKTPIFPQNVPKLKKAGIADYEHFRSLRQKVPGSHTGSRERWGNNLNGI
jgi:hypothetical protein